MRNSEGSGDVVVVGRACRLPGAATVEQFWSNLLAGRCSVSEIPADRWSKERHGHPRAKEPGRSYVWAAGAIGDVWSFDPSVFGISPREAEQMDPQQRLLLELTWEALEDAGLRRSDLAGTGVGVFVGASSTEFWTLRNADIASGDAYTATGGALSIVSNRISHVFDFRGPSFTVDTACSSSLVALHQAMQALRGGEIDTAIVAGVNLLLSPYGFIAFAQASMLSPDGLCRTFDAGANGYVRAEGGVVLVLRSERKAAENGDRIYARIVASGVNSDGRTNGIALPSRHSQAALLRDVYRTAGIENGDLAFVEAHGTGTRVGDPIEATTIGEVLGQGRCEPLLVGSAKSNIGHLEPASGLAGVLKALLALEHDVLPPSLHFAEPNPDIAFGELNLVVPTAPTAIPRRERPRLAGVNSFGFGGTNAHVVLGDMPARAKPSTARHVGTSDLLALSGTNEAVVRELARGYAERLAATNFEGAREIAAAAAHRRELLGERCVVEWASPRDLVRKLERIADREADVPGVTCGSVAETNGPVAFVFSGNGSQWPGMGQDAYRANRRFRETFDEIDALFDAEFGWSITEALFAPDLEQRLRKTHIAQPLIFSIQIAITRALADEGLRPSVTIGHSVGEIAAATVAGGLSLRDGVRVIQARSARQELAHDAGRMAVLVASRDGVEALIGEIGGIEIAAENSPRTFTVAGGTDEIARLGKLARTRRIVFRQLDLDYPFHCGLIDPVREPLLQDLADVRATVPTVPMVSTVTGEPVSEPLGAEYWWRNVREPVRFSAAVERAAKDGARVFVEIGPRSVLLSNINETLEPSGIPFASLGVLENKDGGADRDPIRPAVIAAFTRGAVVDTERMFGPRPDRPTRLPPYPWQRRDFRLVTSQEAIGSTLDTRFHRLAGYRNTSEGVEWANILDTSLVPELADHVVGGQPILPAAAFIEIALHAGREGSGGADVALIDLDITQPLPLEHDRAREIKTRIAPATGLVEILSRPRLARSGWTVHATARIAPVADAPAPVPDAWLDTSAATVADADAIYEAADAVGLRYGPTFRLLRSVARVGDNHLVATLDESSAIAPYGVDPARLDACFHGLFVLFSGLNAPDRGTAYIPVHFGQVRLVQPGAVPVGAVIEIVRAAEGSIVADFTLVSAAGEVVAVLTESRFQAARVQRPNRLADKALRASAVPIDLGALGRPGSAVQPSDLLRLAGPAATEGEDVRSDAQLLLEGWAAAAGLELARRFATEDVISASRLAELDRAVARWLEHTLLALEETGLATRDGDDWSLAGRDALPESGTILRTIASEHPERAAELLLAGRLSAEPGGAGLLPPGTAALDGFDLGGTAVRAASSLVGRLVREAGLPDARDGAPRVLIVGYGPLAHELAADFPSSMRLTVHDPEGRRLERAKLALRGGLVGFADSAAALPAGGFDAILAAEGLSRLCRDPAALAELRSALAPGGLLLAVEPGRSAFRDLVFGLSPDWLGQDGSPFPLGPLRSAAEWRADLAGSGFTAVEVAEVSTGAEGALLLAAKAADLSEATPGPERRSVAIHAHRSGRASALPERLDALLAHDGHDVRLAERDRASGPAGEAVQMLLIAPASGGNDLEQLRAGSLALKNAADLCTAGTRELWIVVESGRGATAMSDPVAAGLLAFARTLANELPAVTVRRVAIEPGTDPDVAANGVRTLLGSGSPETDLTIGSNGVRALRFLPLDSPVESATGPSAPAAKLRRGSAGGLGGLGWRAAERPAPGTGEVEIAVAATGLNFRDVMWAMSLLPDDILEDGFAGPSLGLECAGTVSRVGPGVTRLAPGDRVLSFAPEAFSTHVVVPDAIAAPIPAGWTTEAAASVPVAFLTAYYGLVTLGGLKGGDWVLIHGAAGGVGLAAIQIAQARGATIVATAGSPEKRDLLRALGVRHVLNSRSTAFTDDLRRLRRSGVDIVLNSLSGEAMERGLSVLKPFGRFIELGKRDYVANTRIGLRPFRRNLSYFGVDVDQLLSDRERAVSIFGEVMELFADGTLSPLPHRVFSAGETLDAFRLMQQSGHVGKIVLTPPTRPVAAVGSAPFRFDAERTHLLTGGFGGFGIETARWLADRGVRHLVLVGRSGPGSDDATALLDELASRGVHVLARACDVADRGAVAALLREVDDTMPPLAGILHAAMVLDDAAVANLTADQLDRVLAPKVAGAAHLDALTAGRPLDYFVMFSSITTFIGNPGQAAYVAANGHLEGLARLRREAGRPGLALAWGAISDVGVLARRKGLAEALAKRVGVTGMPARDALDLMVQALSRDAADPNGAVLAVGSLDWGAARRLPALASPTFAALVGEGSAVELVERETIDLQSALATEPVEDVRKRVVAIIVEEIASVLRIPKADVSPVKRLAELGLDSLMAIELATALGDRFRLDTTPSGSVGSLTAGGLADQLIASVSAGHPDGDVQVAQALNDRHGVAGLDAAAVAPVVGALAARAGEARGLAH